MTTPPVEGTRPSDRLDRLWFPERRLDPYPHYLGAPMPTTSQIDQAQQQWAAAGVVKRRWLVFAIGFILGTLFGWIVL